jgi:hypothetical protein
VSPEGTDTATLDKLVLPNFASNLKQRYFIDIYLSDSVTVEWKTSTSEKWIKLSQENGILSPENGKNQLRIWVSVDWSQAPGQGELTGKIVFEGTGKNYPIEVYGFRQKRFVHAVFNGFVEDKGYVSIYAQHYTERKNGAALPWGRVEGLGHTGASMMTDASDAFTTSLDTVFIRKTASYLAYDFVTFTQGVTNTVIYTLPTLPLNKSYGMRCAVAIDDGPLQFVDFVSNSTARTEEWKQNVLSNTAVRKLQGSPLKPAMHKLKIFAIDPGVILDRIIINLGGMKDGYGVLPETK